MDQAQAVVSLFMKEVHAYFPGRIVSIFILGSLNSPINFSSCSDIDIAIMLDNIIEKDTVTIDNLQKKIAQLDLPFSDKLSVFWSSYNVNDFVSTKGRFPPLDRLILIKQASLIFGNDYRSLLPAPTHGDIIIGGADFISRYMLPEEKIHELLHNIEAIINKGARYFTKFTLFPVRLLFSLDKPNCLASNLDAVNYLIEKYTGVLSEETLSLVQLACQYRQSLPEAVPTNIHLNFLQTNLTELYAYCLQRYYHFMLKNNINEQARNLQSILDEIITTKVALRKVI